MPRSNFFTHFGLLSVRNFLDADLCMKLRSEMCSLAGSPATVGVTEDNVVTRMCGEPNGSKFCRKQNQWSKNGLQDLQPRLEGHFNVTLKGFEKLQFLVYPEGCFYAPHQDSSDDPVAVEYVRERKVSVVIFLNNESDDPSEQVYGGGRLTFYGLMEDPLERVWIAADRRGRIADRLSLRHYTRSDTRDLRYAAHDRYLVLLGCERRDDNNHPVRRAGDSSWGVAHRRTANGFRKIQD
jgi:SM-20-related protein